MPSSRIRYTRAGARRIVDNFVERNSVLALEIDFGAGAGRIEAGDFGKSAMRAMVGATSTCRALSLNSRRELRDR